MTHSKKEKTLSVSAIMEGTVIDHIAAGQALHIVQLLQLGEKSHITLGMNLKSGSKGYKDIIKIEGVFLTPEQTDHIALFSPEATVNVIQHYKVIKKYQVTLPSTISKILSCPNPHCITRHETVPTLFSVEENNQRIFLRCHFCEKIFPKKQ